MIAIDTNVLLRYVLADHAKHPALAEELILAKRPVLITDVVLAEAIWTLSGNRYSLDKMAVCEFVRGLLGDSAFRFENSQVIWSALMDYQELKRVRGKALDFPDALIVRKAHHVAENAGYTLDTFDSFDKALGQLSGTATPG